MEAFSRNGPKSFSQLDLVSATSSDSSRFRLPLIMTPLGKANLRILLMLIVGSLLMTAFWIYFIIAKEPLRL
jgi:hypothetical protein